MKCAECGFCYCETIAKDVKEHLREHNRFLDAKDKHNYIFTYEDEEDLKRKGYDIIGDDTLNPEQKIPGVEQVFHALFSRSISSTGYSSKHPDVSTFISMLLDAKDFWSNKLTAPVYKLMVDKYGTSPGIAHGFTLFKLL